MGCFQVRYDSRVVNYKRKLFIRFATVCKAKKLTTQRAKTTTILILRTVNVGGRITVQMDSSLNKLDLTKQEKMFYLNVLILLNQKPVKLEASHTVILNPIVSDLILNL